MSLSPIGEHETKAVGSALDTFREPTFSESIFHNVSKENLREILGDRSVVLFLINATQSSTTSTVSSDTAHRISGSGALIASAPQNILENTFFRNLAVERSASDLQPYNPLGIPLESSQIIVIIRDESLMIGALTALSFCDTYALKLRVLVGLQALDKFQAYDVMSSNLRWLISVWLQSIEHDNEIMWKNMKDKFPELFSIRRFRLEIHGIGEAESKLQGVKRGEGKEFINDDYSQLAAKDRVFATSYDEKFKSMSPTQYEQHLTEQEVLFIAGWLLKLREHSLLIEMWCALATSFDFYHFAILPKFQRMVDDIDEQNITGQFIRPLMYLMYREESSFKTDATTDMRHVLKLSQLTQMRWLQPPETRSYFTNVSHNMLLPVIRSSYKIASYASRYGVSSLVDISQYKQRLSILTMGVLDGIKIEGVYITGGLSSACLIRGTSEQGLWFSNFRDYAKTNKWKGYQKSIDSRTIANRHDPQDEYDTFVPAVRDVALAYLGLPSNLASIVKPHEIQTVNTSTFLQVTNRNYADADVDIPIFARDQDEFRAKMQALQDHINLKLKFPESKTGFKFALYKGERYRMVLPNGRALEVFYMTTSSSKTGAGGAASVKGSPLSMIFNFHVPPVRHYFDPLKDEVFMLPSCVWSAWTGLCLDIKYFASSRDPREILYKYYLRGYIFILNREEMKYFREYENTDEVKAMGEKLGFPIVGEYRSARELAKLTKRFAKPLPKYMRNHLWSIGGSSEGMIEKVNPWEYPRNLDSKLTQLQLNEGPTFQEHPENIGGAGELKEHKEAKESKANEPIAASIRVRPWERQYILIPRRLEPRAAPTGFGQMQGGFGQMQGGFGQMTAGIGFVPPSFAQQPPGFTPGSGQMPGFVLPFPPMQQPLGLAQPRALSPMPTYTGAAVPEFIPPRFVSAQTYAGAAPVPRFMSSLGHTVPMYYTPAVSSQPMGLAPASFPAPVASLAYPMVSPHITSFSATPPTLP